MRHIPVLGFSSELDSSRALRNDLSCICDANVSDSQDDIAGGSIFLVVVTK